MTRDAVTHPPPTPPYGTTQARLAVSQALEDRARGGLAPHMLLRAQAFLLDNFESVRPVGTIAGDLGLSPGHFGRAFRQAAGLSPRQWRMNARIAAAKAMIAAGPSRLAEVALACGFSDQAHLTRAFKRQAGLSPAAWRRSHADRFLIEKDLP